MEVNIKYDDFFDGYRKLLMKYKMKEYVLKYAVENCISYVNKSGLSEYEKDCLTNRAFTFKLTEDNFNTHQKNNFDLFN